MQRWRTLAAMSCMVVLLLQAGFVCADVCVDEHDEFMREYEEKQRQLQADATPDDPALAEPSSTTTDDGPPPPPQPIPTPDPNIPLGLEEMELLAFQREYAEEKAMNALMEWAYNWVVRDRGYDDGFLRAKDLPDFLHRTLNPAEEDIDDEERALLTEATTLLREEQGLHDDYKILHIGFLSRGSPVQYVRELAQKMHTQRRMRRLSADDRDL